MPLEQTNTTAPMDETPASVDLIELTQCFPDLTVYNYIFDTFNQLNSNVELSFKEVQLLLEEGKNRDDLMAILVNAIAKIEALTEVADKMSRKQIAVNDLKQKLIEEFNPHYHRYQSAEAQLRQIKKTLAENLYQVFTKFKKAPATNAIEILPESIIQDNEENLSGLDDASSIIINEKLERSAIYITKLVNGETGDWEWSAENQLQLINQITKTAEQLLTETHFAPFTAWQKNILFARLHAGFSWSESSKSLETSLDSEKNAVTKKLLEEPFKSDAYLSFAEEEFLLSDINLTLAQLRASLPNFYELLEMQNKVKAYLGDCKNLSPTISNLIDSLLSTFKQIAEYCQGSGKDKVTLAEKTYEFTSHSLEHYLQEQSFLLEERIAKLEKMSALLLDTQELPIDDGKRLTLFNKLKLQFSESSLAYQEILAVKAIFSKIEDDLIKARNPVPKTSESARSENLTPDEKDFSSDNNLNHDMHEAKKNMKMAYRYIKGFKGKNSPAIGEDIQENSENESPNATETTSSPSFLKKHWRKLLFNTFLFSLISVTALILSGGLLPLATLLADALLISTPFAGGLVSLATAGGGALLGVTTGSIGAGFIGKPVQGFWKNHGRDVLIGTAIGLAVFTGVMVMALIGCATFGIGPLTVLSGIGSATAASLTVFGANITTAAGIAVGFSLLTSAIAAISATTTAFIAAIFDGKRKQLPPRNAQPVNQLTEVINPDIDPDADANTELTHKTVNEKLSAQPNQQPKTKNADSQDASHLTKGDIAALLTSFAETPKMSESPLGFHNQGTDPVQNDAAPVMNEKPVFVR